MRFIRFFTKRIIILLLVVIIGILLMKSILAEEEGSGTKTIWHFQSIDTMKYSRDAAADPESVKKIPVLVKEIADLGATTIAIDTPYDERFYPVLATWVAQARKNGLHVWFRGNFSGWEGWFDYQQFTDPSVHHKMTTAFITAHPELFQEGDIFTPVPEAENGVIGDPRGSDAKSAEYNQFLVDSYNNCIAAFKTINKTITCGYFSMNGDIAKDVLTPETVAQTGNVVVIDHYVDSATQMASDIGYLHQKFPEAKIVLGEFGAPIDDINGPMTESQQAAFIQSLLTVFYEKRKEIDGINYWVIAGGSTALLHDNNTPKKAAATIADFYKPFLVTGKVTDDIGNTVANATVTTSDGTYLVHTDKDGSFQLALMPEKKITITTVHQGYTSSSVSVMGSANMRAQENFTLQLQNKTAIQRILVFFKNLFSK